MRHDHSIKELDRLMDDFQTTGAQYPDTVFFGCLVWLLSAFPHRQPDISFIQAKGYPNLLLHGIVAQDASGQPTFLQLLLQPYNLLQAAGLLDPLL